MLQIFDIMSKVMYFFYIYYLKKIQVIVYSHCLFDMAQKNKNATN